MTTTNKSKLLQHVLQLRPKLSGRDVVPIQEAIKKDPAVAALVEKIKKGQVRIE